MASAVAKAAHPILVLRDLPRTALVSDVRRLLVKHNVENVKSVHRGYRRFQPDGNAFVTFTHPSQTQVAVAQLKKAQISGYNIDVTSAAQLQNTPQRSRGIKGRQEAADRGIITGTGPDAGVTERGRSVVIWGLPGRWNEEILRGFLEHKGFRLAGNDMNHMNIVKVEPTGRASVTSRHYVRMESSAEAHRLVRRLHMGRYERRGAKDFILRAQVVY